MTTIVNTSEPGDEQRLPLARPEPTFTRDQIKQHRLTDHRTAMLVERLHAMTVQHHGLAGTPRHEWLPTKPAVALLAAFYNEPVADKLEFELGQLVDPRIKRIADSGEEIETHVQDVDERNAKVTSAETGLVYPEDLAVGRVEANQAKISADIERGSSHHKRVHRLFRLVGKGMPYLEVGGLLAIVTYVVDVEWTRPSQDPLTWTLAAVIVLATVLFTPRVVERSAEGWNRRREAVAENHIDARRRATRKILVNGIIAMAASMAIVAGLVERALTVIDNTIPQSVLTLIIALAVIAGLAMPALAFLAVAWDGSSLSRENDSLVKQLDVGLKEDQQLRSDAMALHHECEQEELHINSTVASLLSIGYRAADEMRETYAILLVQLGVDGDLHTRATVRPTGEGSDCISTGIPGADPIRLEPLVRRGLRLQELQRRRTDTITRLNALPAHPWAANRTTS